MRVSRSFCFKREAKVVQLLCEYHETKSNCRIMRVLISIAFMSMLFLQSSAYVYEESISEMLIQCNGYQRQATLKNRTIHACEKEDPDGDFSYFITPMKTHYSQREFLCVLFFKDEHSKLDFELLFSHAKYQIDAVSRCL